MENLNNKIEWNEGELKVLKSKILKRVQFTWFMRKVILPTSSVILASLAVLLYAAKTQHVAMIYKNIAERVSAMDLVGLAKYFFVAVQKTELDTLLMLGSGSLLLAFFSRRLIVETINYWARGVAGRSVPKNIR